MEDNRVIIFDTTLRDGEQAAGVNLNVQEKVQLANQLCKLKVDVIEAGFAAASPGDFDCVAAIAKVAKGTGTTVASLARTREADIRAAAKALEVTDKARIHTFIATSQIHMEYKLKMTREQVLNEVRSGVSLAHSLCKDVEFSAEDASRSDLAFLIEVFKLAIECGATTLNIPDTVGYAVPDEYGAFVKKVIEGVNAPKNVIYSVHCHDDLGLAVANSLAALKAGARQVEGTINGLGERGGNAALEEVVMALKTRRDFYGLTSNLVTQQLMRTSQLTAKLTGVAVPPNKAIVGGNAFSHEAGIHQHGILANRATYEIMNAEDVGAIAAVLVLGKHSGKHAFKDRLSALGYQLSEEQIEIAFKAFKLLCDAKKDVTDADLEALVIDNILGISTTDAFVYKNYTVQAGCADVPASAMVNLTKGKEGLRDAAVGNGPVDAAYNAIKRIIGFEPTLTQFQIKATSQLSDALGEAIVVLEHDGIKAQGRGASTDIIEASVKAYVNAVNRLLILTTAKEAKNNGN
ncbi:2-isopropylmalate synthase [Desulfovibrio litoralis]|uniref:2-isopropylmalate synthase n=1 Tax=Desulfovibrio litoralis DSM 11393 TaxID=1121455 RepID=A0A1M7SP07_9BACT|nr:2-isopropylmalate synthase [Desulfovibrio litoralis]SHN60190.1 2-isopropylmalate synthase [Desulfovibrio litoralis DSM 11393]